MVNAGFLLINQRVCSWLFKFFCRSAHPSLLAHSNQVCLGGSLFCSTFSTFWGHFLCDRGLNTIALQRRMDTWSGFAVREFGMPMHWTHWQIPIEWSQCNMVHGNIPFIGLSSSWKTISSAAFSTFSRWICGYFCGTLGTFFRFFFDRLKVPKASKSLCTYNVCVCVGLLTFFSFIFFHLFHWGEVVFFCIII